MNFDEMTGPASFAQLLNPQAAQQQAPEMGGMAEVLGAAPEQPAGPSIFERAKGWAEANPMASQMLLNTFMTMARGGHSSFGEALGEGVANGATAGLVYQAQTKADREKAEKEARQAEKEKRELELRERGVQIQEGQFNLERDMAPVKKRYQSAQAASLEQQTANSAAAAPLERQQIQARIAQIQQQIRESQDSVTTNALKRQLTALQIVEQGINNDVKAKTALPMAQAQVAGAEAQNVGRVLDNENQGLINDQQRQLNDDMAGLTPQQRLAMKQGSQAKVKTDDELIIEFANRNLDLFQDAKGNVNIEAARKAYYDLTGKQPPQAQGGVMPAAGPITPEVRAAWEKARNSVPVGKPYRGPDGKMYVRKS